MTDFLKALEESLFVHAGKPWEKGLVDLNDLAEKLNTAVIYSSKGRLGTGLISIEPPSANVAGNKNFDLVIVRYPERTQILERIDRFSIQQSGHYPILVVNAGAVMFGIGDRDGLEARLMAHVKTWQSRLIIKIQEALNS